MWKKSTNELPPLFEGKHGEMISKIVPVKLKEFDGVRMAHRLLLPDSNRVQWTGHGCNGPAGSTDVIWWYDLPDIPEEKPVKKQTRKRVK